MQEAPNTEITVTQWAAKRIGGGAQQLTTVNVIFFAIDNGLDELATRTPVLTNFNVLPPGNRYVKELAIRSNIDVLPPCNCNNDIS